MEPKKKQIDIVIDNLLYQMSDLEAGTEEYKLAAESVKILYEARSKRPSFPIEPEAILAGLVNILGIVLIIKHEQFNVISTRAIGFIRRP